LADDGFVVGVISGRRMTADPKPQEVGVTVWAEGHLPVALGFETDVGCRTGDLVSAV
jgi:hypothetical protein